MTTRSQRTRALALVFVALAGVAALASGCELAVQLDLSLAETDGGPAVCALCLDGAVEPDGNIVYGAQDAGVDASEDAEVDGAKALDGGSSDAGPDADAPALLPDDGVLRPSPDASDPAAVKEQSSSCSTGRSAQGSWIGALGLLFLLRRRGAPSARA